MVKLLQRKYDEPQIQLRVTVEHNGEEIECVIYRMWFYLNVLPKPMKREDYESAFDRHREQLLSEIEAAIAAGRHVGGSFNLDPRLRLR